MNALQVELSEIRKDINLARMYAKSSCRHCYGRGYTTCLAEHNFQLFKYQSDIMKDDMLEKHICSCVMKKLTGIHSDG